MLNLPVIRRYFHAGWYEPLLDELCESQLELPLSLRVRLSHGPVCAVALGLRRLVELTYGPTELSRDMLRRLIDWQAPDGSFDRGDPLATAAAAAALGRLLREHRHTAVEPEDVAWMDRADAAYHAAVQSLTPHQFEDGLLGAMTDTTTTERAGVSALVLYLLAGDEAWRRCVDLAALLAWFEDHHDTLEPAVERLWLMAQFSLRSVTAAPAAPELFTRAPVAV